MSISIGYGPRRSLVHDEVVSIRRKKHQTIRAAPHAMNATARIRVWRAKEWMSVVLVSQVPGGPPPSWDTSLFANYALSAILKHDPEGMAYFEDEQSDRVRKLLLYGFSEAGCVLRKTLYNPTAKEQDWAILDEMAGEPVKRDACDLYRFNLALFDPRRNTVKLRARKQWKSTFVVTRHYIQYDRILGPLANVRAVNGWADYQTEAVTAGPFPNCSIEKKTLAILARADTVPGSVHVIERRVDGPRRLRSAEHTADAA